MKNILAEERKHLNLLRDSQPLLKHNFKAKLKILCKTKKYKSYLLQTCILSLN